MIRNIVYKFKEIDNGVEKLTNVNPIKENNQTDLVWWYAPYGANTTKVKFVTQAFLDLTNVNPIPSLKMTPETDQEVIDAIMPEGTQETGWSLYYFPIGIGVSGILKSNRATKYEMSFQELDVDLTDADYLGNYATDSTVDATVNTELLAYFPLAVEGNYSNVYQTTSNVYVSWVLVSGTWTKGEILINEQLISNTLAYRETFKATTLSNDDFNIGTPTEQALVFNQIYGELDELNNAVAAIIGDVSSFMTKSEYDIDDNGIVDKAESVDDGTYSKSAEEISKGIFDAIRLNGDVDTGKASWNSTDNTWEIILNTNVTLQVGQEELIYAYNNTGSDITNGKVVYLSGASGNKPTVALASNTEKVKSHNTIGIATEILSNNDSGFVTTRGFVRGLNTSAFSEGDLLYLTSDGRLTDTEPEAPLFKVQVGIVVTSNAGAGVIYVGVEKVHQIAEAPDVYAPSPVDGDLLEYKTNRYENLNKETFQFVKTGWDLDVQTLLSLSFIDITRTFTLAKTGAVVPYWQENIKYELDGDLSVVIDDVEGLWFIYIVDGVLIANQTAWDLRADNAIPVSVVNWDATNKEAVAVAYECHSWLMSGVDHYDSHFGLGTIHIRGGGLSDNGSDQLDLTGLTIADEDINIVVIDNDTPTAYFEQPLTPLKAYKNYRLGANGDLRRADDSTIPFLLDGNRVQLNPFNGSDWELVDMNLNKYGAYWNIWTTDIAQPIKQFLGQEEADSLDDAIASNTLSSLDLGTIPFEEIKVAYRIIVKQLVSSPYYEITQIDNMLVDPVTGVPTLAPTSHGALSGLGDNDHTQYSLWTDLLLVTTAIKLGYDGSTGFSGKVTVQEALDQAKADIDTISSGGIADNTITDAKLVTDIKIGSIAAYNTEFSTAFATIEEIVTDINTRLSDAELDIIKLQDEILSSDLVEVFYAGETGAYATDKDGTSHAIEGETTTTIETTKGLSVNQVLLAGLGDDLSTWTINAQITTDGTYFIADTSSSLTFDKNISLPAGDYYVVTKAFRDSDDGSSIGLQFLDGVSVEATFNLTGLDTVENRISEIITLPTAITQIKWERGPVGTNVNIREIMIIPVTNNAQLNTLTAEQISSRIPLYIEGINSIENLNIDSTGKNKFDYLEASVDDNLAAVTIIEDGINLNGTYFAIFDKDMIAGKSYTMSWNVSTVSGTPIPRWLVIYEDGTNSGTMASGASLTLTKKGVQLYLYVASGTTASADFTNIQLELGTVATDYEDYITSNLVVRGTMRSVGDVYDTPTLQSVEVDINDVVQDTTGWSSANILTNTKQYYKNLSSILGYRLDKPLANAILIIGDDTYNSVTRSFQNSNDIGKNIAISTDELLTIRVDIATFPNSSDFEAYLQANDVHFEYELATPIPQELDIDGAILTSVDATFVQSSDNGLNNIFSVIQAENKWGRVDIMNDTLLTLNKEVKEVAEDLDTAEARITVNESDIETNGSDIADLQAVGIKTESHTDITTIAGWWTELNTIRIYRNETASGVITTFNILATKYDPTFADDALIYINAGTGTITSVTSNSDTWTRIYYE